MNRNFLNTFLLIQSLEMQAIATSQTLPLFSSIGTARKLSKSSISHFDQAIKHLRLILANGKAVQLYSNEFGKQFAIGSSALTALYSLGALDRQKAGNGTFKYSAKPLLDIISPELVIKHIRQDAERTAKQRKEKSEAAQIIVAAPNPITEGETSEMTITATTANGEVKVIKGNIAILPNPNTSIIDSDNEPEVFLIGVVENGILTCNIGPMTRYDDQEQASDYLSGYHCEDGEKLVLLKVVEVVEPTRVLQPSTL